MNRTPTPPATDHPIAVIGETVADAVTLPGAPPHALRLEVRPGGGPANTAVALARLGSPTRFFGRLSEGVLGRLSRDRLAAAGVDLSHAVTESRQATLAVTALDERGRAAYDFYTEGTADWYWSAAELAGLSEASIIHTGSLALALPPGGPVIAEALRRHRSHAMISIDPNVRPGIADVGRYRRALDDWAGVADVLKLSEDDLAATHPGHDLQRLCEGWHDRGCRLVVVTLGERGAVASLAGRRVRVAAPRVDVADTIGAGDAFTAGLLHRLAGQGHGGGRPTGLDLDELTDALNLACRVAARVCEVPGADPPRPDTQPDS